MTEQPSLGLFGTTEARLLDGIKQAGQGSATEIPDSEHAVLAAAGLVHDLQLTPAGLELYRTAWVLRRSDQATRDLGQALRSLLPLQVIEQELRGFGAVPEDGVLDLLRLHRAVPTALTADDARRTFLWMNAAGVLVYSRKHKTVRCIAPDTEAAVAGEADSMAAMVSPRTPFSNVARLRRILRQTRGIVTWADPHFGARALEELVTELDPARVQTIRILSGNADNVLTEKSFKDFKRFRDEMKNKGITAEWRVDSKRDWHDRWLVDDNTRWNMPPVNNLFQNQYSEMLPTESQPPVEEWWKRATPRTS